MVNTFFSNNDTKFTAYLKTFIQSGKGYYIDIYVPESAVIPLLHNGLMVLHDEKNNSFYIRCNVYSSSIILCNGAKLKYISKDLTQQTLITPNNTKIKSLELNAIKPHTASKYEPTSSVVRMVLKTESQKLPSEFFGR